MWFVYIILCRDNSLYTGVTNNLEKRLAVHLAGKGARYTRTHIPIKIIYSEKHKNRGDALKRECAIKKLRRSEKIKLIEEKRTNTIDEISKKVV